ncbi:hypothetical protein [Anditalea andensis]|uniref:Uncharacterized protein n=1 Tax=Anditalea andensis TaxID=1048983 RepID=A0A074KVB4_9BACT|nr:hypothetical protein [Anditalea andensis]KEO72160.1 hypothetical protein EL17_19830 [Anditalea andensis]
MKSFTYIVLITLLSVKALMPNMDLCCDIQKIPAFFDHYQLHKVTYGDNFWDFVEGHYLYNDDEYRFIADDPEHANLPFRENHKNCCTQGIFISKTENYQLNSPVPIHLQHNTLYQSIFNSGLFKSLFQPPIV